MRKMRALLGLAAGAFVCAVALTRLVVPAVLPGVRPDTEPSSVQGAPWGDAGARPEGEPEPGDGGSPRPEAGRGDAARPGEQVEGAAGAPRAKSRRSVPRALVESVLADPAQLRGARAELQSSRGGAPVGYRLEGLQADSPLWRIGLRNGDVLVAVNGRRIDGPDAALQAFAGLREASRLRVVIRRGGARRTLRYRIVTGPR